MGLNYEHPDAIWEGIVACPVHTDVMDEDNCLACEGEFTARNARMEQIIAESQDRQQAIVTNGGPQMPDSLVMQARMEVLIDSVFTNSRDRLKYEGEVGRRIMGSIKEMQKATKQPVLHLPANVKPIR